MPLQRAVWLAAGGLDRPPGKARIALALASGTLTHLAFIAGVAAMMLAIFFGLGRSWGEVP